MKCLAVDLDGTTLNRWNKISDKNLNALKQAHNQGILVVPVTGRSLDMIPESLNNCDFIDYVICSNGAVIYNFKTKEKMYEATIPNQECISFLEELPSFYLSANIDGHIVLQSGWIGTLYQFLRKNNKTKFLKVNKIKSYLKDTKKDVECFQMYTLRKSIHYQMMNILKKYPSLIEANINAPENRYTEIFSYFSSKGKALLFLKEHLQLEWVYSIGDGQNDLSLFEVSDFSMAMGNGHKDCKEKANVILPSNNKDGLSFGIEKYVLKG